MNRRDSGFSLVELLIVCAVFAVLYAGVHGLFTSTWTAWRRQQERVAPYEEGLTLVDSITRDARPARDATGTTATLVAGNLGNNLKLVLNQPARYLGPNRWEQKRVTYQNTADGFKRWVETAETANPTDDISTGTNKVTREWVLSRAVTSFQFERYDLFTTASHINKRIIRFFLTLQTGAGGRYKVNGRVFIRRSPANANPVGVTY